MKAYLLFSGHHYYPCGGVDDYKGDFDTVLEAYQSFKDGYMPEWSVEGDEKDFDEWYQVVESATMRIVKAGSQ